MIWSQVLKKTAAFMLVLWYSFCVIGFDIHTCKSSDSQFISTFVGGFSCSDVHPEHSCLHCHDHFAHGSSSGHTELSDMCCCSNLYHSLEVTGSRSTDTDGHSHEFCHCGLYPAVTVSMAFQCFSLRNDFSDALFPEAPSELLSKDINSVFSIWRI